MDGDVELAEVRDFLARHPPFDGLPPAVLDGLPRELSVEYARRGSTLGPGGGVRVLRSGAVDVHDADGTLFDRCGEGDCVGPLGRRRSGEPSLQATAIEDSLLLHVPEPALRRLCRDHPPVARFFDARREASLRHALVPLHQSVSGSPVLRTPLSTLTRRDPVSVATAVTVREAAEVMASAAVSCVLVMDGERLAGIVTDRDLRNRVLAAGLDPAAPVTTVMTPHPVTASRDSLAFEALLDMVARNIHHLPVTHDGRPIGVVTATDLMRLERADPVHLVRDISKQADVDGVAATGAQLPAVVQSLVAQDASAEEIGRVATAVGDALERQLLLLAEEELGPPPVPYCWVALGSRARLEQALAADQDHALILDDSVTPAQEEYFSSLARRVSEGLERCGYPPCRGDVMATNRRWRTTVAGWERHFAAWLGEPTPEAVLRAGIFFDMRPVHGERSLFSAVMEPVLRAVPSAGLFLAHLARQAVSHETPLGFFRSFVLEKHGGHRDTVDIKQGGTGAVVELARVYALFLGSAAVHTQQRLAAAASAGALGQDRAADLRDAFEFVGYVRLRHQATQVREGRPVDNHVSPASLSSFEKRHLRDAFGVVRAAQADLSRRHSLHYIS